MFIQSKNDVNFRMIGAKLKKIRRSRGLRQEDVAKAIGMESYGNYERGSEEISLWRVAQLCELYDVTMGDVLNDCSAGLVLRHEDTKLSLENMGDDPEEYASVLNQVRTECVSMPLSDLRAVLTMTQALNSRRKK